MKTSPFQTLRPTLRPAAPLLILPLLLISGMASPRALAAPSGAALAQTAWLDPVILGVSAVEYGPLVAQASPPDATPGPLDGIISGSASPASSPAPTPVAAVPVPVVPAVAPSPAVKEVVIPAPTPAPAVPAPAPSLPRRGGMNNSGPAPASGATGPRGGILLNFQNAALADVLTYLSQEAGFVIVQEAQVSGTVNVVSRQPLSADDAVDLLNSVLADKGLTAVRTNRILKIVSRSNALKYDLPVNQGAVVENIPASDTVVTQVMQLRYGEAAKLVENLRPLLAETSYISANEGSNAIILTDSQVNIRRIAKIIRALDTSVSSISSIQVFELHYADSKALADIVTQLFSASGATGANRNQQQQGGGFPGFGGQGGRGGQGGGGGQQAAAQSEALKAAVRVVAVADEQSNSLIVSAPDELMPNIKDIISQVDKSTTDITETRIFRLQNADSVELADIINNLYGDPTTNQNSQNNRNTGNNRNQQQRQGGFPGFPGQPQQAAASAGSQRSLLQSKVTAVGDPRTNSLIVSASHDTMPQISLTIGRLDATDAKKQHTYVFKLTHADPDAVADVLRGMTGGQVQNTQSGTNALTTRQQQGAALDTTSFSTSNTGAASARGR
jgi:general secretion pathway protein D